MQNINPDRLLRRKTQTVGAHIEDGYIMLDLDNGKYIQLNPIAEIIWELLETPRSLSTITELLQEKFDVEPERCRVEVAALLDQLLRFCIVDYQG